MKYIQISELKPHPKNNYYFDDSEEGAYQALKISIRENNGKLNNPILITKDNIIISGHQRVKACRELGIHSVPCKEVDHKLNEKQLEIMLIEENLTSRNSSKGDKIKIGRCIDTLCEYYGIENGNNQYMRHGNNFSPTGNTYTTMKDLADAFGVKPRTLNNYQALARSIEEVQTAVENNLIKSTTGFDIARLDEQEQRQVMQKINSSPSKRLTGEDVKKIIEEIKAIKPNTMLQLDQSSNFQKQGKETISNNTAITTTDDDNCVVLNDINNYIAYGQGDKYEQREFKHFIECVNNPECISYYLKYLSIYQTDIFNTLEKYHTIIQNNRLNSMSIRTLNDDLQSQLEEMEEILEDLNTFIESSDSVIDMIDNILGNDEDDTEIWSVGDNGKLYNYKGQQIGYIVDYNNQYEYSYVGYLDENNTGEDVAYDENDNLIGKIVWTYKK